MFSECKDMGELNLRRIQLYNDPNIDSKEVNRCYIARRKELLSRISSDFRPIPFVRLNQEREAVKSALTVEVTNAMPGVITFEKGVFYV